MVVESESRHTQTKDDSGSGVGSRSQELRRIQRREARALTSARSSLGERQASADGSISRIITMDTLFYGGFRRDA